MPSSSRLPVKQDLHVPKSRLRVPRDISSGSTGTIHTISEPIIQDETPKELDSRNEYQISISQKNRLQDTTGELSNLEDDFAKPPNTPLVRRRPRPSLSERTIETLSQVPPSPSPQRRKSGFNPSERPLSSLSRPASSLSQPLSGKKTCQYPPIPSTPRKIPPNDHSDQIAKTVQLTKSASNQRSFTSTIPRSLPRGSTRSYDLPDSTPSKVPPVPRLPSTETLRLKNPKVTQASSCKVEQKDKIDGSTSKTTANLSQLFMQSSHGNAGARKLSKPGSGAKTFSISSSRQRPAIDDIFTQPSLKIANPLKHRTQVTTRRVSAIATTNPPEGQRKFSTSRIKSSLTLKESHPMTSDNLPLKDSPKSSAALRETIAKAKAARRAAGKSNEVKSEAEKATHDIVRQNCLFEDLADVKNVLGKRLSEARTSGRLNIAALGLTKFPEEVKDMDNLEKIESAGSKWYESVDLVRLIAADNEFETFEDWVFPDISASAAGDLDDSFCGNMFQGLETLDLHGNRLRALPEGIKQLDRLVTLNLSKNRLTNLTLELLGQIMSLRELRLGENEFNGPCLGSLKNLSHLEILDLHDNALVDLSVGVPELLSLRVLLVAGNKLTSIPFELLQSLPLREINAARNKLGGTLISQGVNSLAMLKHIDVSHNALTSFSENATNSLPLLEILNVAENRLASIPNMAEWQNLITFSAGGNNIDSIPEGLTSLPKLRSVDFTRNSLKRLDNHIGLMDNLTVLLIAHNPLRERRHLSMHTEDLKRELRDRVLPVESMDVLDCSAIGAPQIPPLIAEVWPMKPGGILDRSSTKLEEIESSSLESILQTGDIKTLDLHHNLFSHIPASIDLTSSSLAALNLSHNKLTSTTYISSSFSLPSLKSLDLSSNSISSLTPLLTLLSAPSLSVLNISYNKLTSLPILRTTYPVLNTLYAANNNLVEINVETVRGLEVLDVSGNSIGHLDPRLGLLAEEGLRTLAVGANVFRVPRRDVVEKGTGALLAWLKGRIPSEEVGR